jgi:hypothetical protein
MVKKVSIDDQHGMGWIKSKPDPRDMTHPKVLAFWKSFVPVESLPASVDLRSGCIPVMDQGDIGSCTANAADALCGFRLIKEGYPVFQGARLATYFWTRLLEGTPNEDAGAEIRDTIKTIVDYGLADEKLWPYNTSKFTTKPTQAVVTDAAQRKAVTYVLIDQPGMTGQAIVDAMKQQLAAGNTMEFGTNCYQSIYGVGSDGMIPAPKKNETPIGGHALHICGYDDSKKAFLLQNSWGTVWGMKGFGYLPYSYFTSGDACDIWIILIENWPVPVPVPPTPTPTPVNLTGIQINTVGTLKADIHVMWSGSDQIIGQTDGFIAVSPSRCEVTVKKSGYQDCLLSFTVVDQQIFTETITMVATPIPPIPPTPVKPDITVPKKGSFSMYIGSVRPNIVGNLVVNGKDFGPIMNISRIWFKPVSLGTFKTGDTITVQIKMPDGTLIHNTTQTYSHIWQEWEIKMSIYPTGQSRKDVVVCVTEK